MSDWIQMLPGKHRCLWSFPPKKNTQKDPESDIHDGSYDISLSFFYFASPPVKMFKIDTAVHWAKKIHLCIYFIFYSENVKFVPVGAYGSQSVNCTCKLACISLSLLNSINLKHFQFSWCLCPTHPYGFLLYDKKGLINWSGLMVMKPSLSFIL